MRRKSAKADLVQASGGERGRSAGLAMPMAESRNEGLFANRMRNRSYRCTGIDRKRWGFARGRDMIGALRRHETKRTLRCWSGRLPVARYWGGPMGHKAAEHKADPVWRRAHRHAKPDARHHRLDRERISDVDGQQAASRRRPNKLPQASHKNENSTDATRWRRLTNEPAPPSDTRTIRGTQLNIVSIQPKRY